MAIAVSLLAGCGDDNNSTAPSKISERKADFDVSKYKDLSICSDKENGKISFVSETDEYYICLDGGWKNFQEATAYENLASCSEKKAGQLGVIAETNEIYVCDGDKWIEYFKATSSSSDEPTSRDAKNSSSSEAFSSSRDVENSSSSVSADDPSLVVEGMITDNRDGHVYKTVTIGTQTWMAENLNMEIAEGS